VLLCERGGHAPGISRHHPPITAVPGSPLECELVIFAVADLTPAVSRPTASSAMRFGA
jgi:hypothetical protein